MKTYYTKAGNTGLKVISLLLRHIWISIIRNGVNDIYTVYISHWSRDRGLSQSKQFNFTK